MERVGLVRLNTTSGKNQSSNGAVKDHINAKRSKHRMTLEMDRMSQTFYGKLSQNVKFPRPDRKCTTKLHERIKMFNSNPGYILDLQTRYDPIEDLPPEVFQNTGIISYFS